jgi:hypothetical protein
MKHTLIADTANFGTGLNPSNPATSGLAAFNTADPLSSTELLFSQIIGFITLLGGMIFIVMFLNGAFKWIAGGEDSAKIQKARDLMVQAVIGLIVMVAGYGIIGLVGSIVGFDMLNPAENARTIFGL